MSNREKSSTRQEVKRNPDGTYAKGTFPATGFHTNPERRHNGSWHKEDTPRYWLETMMKMGEDELMAIWNDTKNSLFKRKIAKCIKDGDWKELKEMIQEVYGKMPEMQITVEADDETKEEANKIIRGFALP